jgi:integrase
MAHIEKRAKDRWRARYRAPDGRERSKTFPRKIEAERWLVEQEAAKATGQWVDPRGGRTLYQEWHARWWEGEGGRASTRARDESYARNHVLPHFGNHRLSAIDYLAIREWVAKLKASGLAPATVHKAHQILSRSLRAAVRAKLIAHNPCDDTETLPKIDRIEMRFLTPSEVAGLAESIRPEYRAFVLLGAYGGLRLGEMLGLRVARLDLMRGEVDVAEILVDVQGHLMFGPPKTKAGHRSVPIPRVVVHALQEHTAGLDSNDLVFRAPEGGPVRASGFRRRVWAPAVKAAGLEPFRIHDLRHTAVSFWMAAAASPNEIARRAGHTSVAVVLDRYGHDQVGKEQGVTEALDAMATQASTHVAQVLDLPRPARGLDDVVEGGGAS